MSTFMWETFEINI